MTFILAANLSDRLLLASDTLVTRLSKGKREVVCYYPKLQQFFNSKADQFVSCLFAGNLEFAKFLSKQLAGAIHGDILPADIDELHGSLKDFFSSTMPKFRGIKKVTMIFAGTAYNTPMRIFDFGNMSKLLGPSGGQLHDAKVVEALTIASRLGSLEELNGQIPMIGNGQKIFKVEINEETSLFSINELQGTYSLISSGSKLLNEGEQKDVLRYFINKRDFINEGKDIANYMVDQFNDTIGGAVMLGTIQQDERFGAMIYAGYEVKRNPEKPSPRDWSFAPSRNGDLIAIDPLGKKIDLCKTHFDKEENEGGLEL